MLARTVFFFGVLIVGGVSFDACRATGQAASTATADAVNEASYVSHEAAIIQRETVRDVRAKTAVRLAQWVRRNPTQVSDADISILIGLLRDDDDVIRGEAAGAIGFVGPRAIAAAPALVQALRERPCTTQPGQSADAMRVALVRIGAAPVNIPCTEPLGSRVEERGAWSHVRLGIS